MSLDSTTVHIGDLILDVAYATSEHGDAPEIDLGCSSVKTGHDQFMCLEPLFDLLLPSVQDKIIRAVNTHDAQRPERLMEYA